MKYCRLGRGLDCASRNHRSPFKETHMTTFRMFAFFGAVIVTALLFRALAYGFSPSRHDAAGLSGVSRGAQVERRLPLR